MTCACGVVGVLDCRCWLEARGGWRRWGGLGPQLPPRPRPQRTQPVPWRGWDREPEAAWVACGSRTARRCRVSSPGLAMGGMTRNVVIKAAVLAGCSGRVLHGSLAQVGLSEWSCDVPVEVLRTLSRAAEQGHCSWASAEAVARHVELHGKPWAAETARRVEGLDAATQRWLERQPWWRRWAMEQVASAAQGPSPSKHSWVIQRSWSAQSLAPAGLGVWRGKTSWAKWTCTTDHPTTWAGSLWGRRGDLRWTLGDHSAAWGQGLTIPRGRTFGTDWHVGDPGLPAPGRLTPSMQTGHHGLMRGLAGEWFRGERTFGASIGPSHVAALARSQQDPDVWLDLEGWMSTGTQRLGLFRGVCGRPSPHSRCRGHGLGRQNGPGPRLCSTGLGRHVVAASDMPRADGCFTSPTLLNLPRCTAWLAVPDRGSAISVEVVCGQQKGHVGSEGAPQAWMALGLHREG